MEENTKEVLCNGCNIKFPIEQTIPFENDNLCESCYNQLTITCSVCDSRVYVADICVYNEKVICPNCYDEYYTVDKNYISTFLIDLDF